MISLVVGAKITVNTNRVKGNVNSESQQDKLLKEIVKELKGIKEAGTKASKLSRAGFGNFGTGFLGGELATGGLSGLGGAGAFATAIGSSVAAGLSLEAEMTRRGISGWEGISDSDFAKVLDAVGLNTDENAQVVGDLLMKYAEWLGLINTDAKDASTDMSDVADDASNMSSESKNVLATFEDANTESENIPGLLSDIKSLLAKWKRQLQEKTKSKITEESGLESPANANFSTIDGRNIYVEQPIIQNFSAETSARLNQIANQSIMTPYQLESLKRQQSFENTSTEALMSYEVNR